MSVKLREWLIIVSIIVVFAFVGYGGKTIYNGESLDIDYWLTGVILICGLVPFYFSKNNKKGKQISDEVAEAMASKIKFEAEQHRKNRDNHNYAKMAYEEEE